MDRLGFQALAEERIDDAKELLAVGRWSAAYYLAGYAVECGLKACVVKRVEAGAGVIFEDRKFSDRCWTHSIDELVKLAKLEVAQAAEIAANPAFASMWAIVRGWKELSRYQTTPRDDARSLFDATTDPTNGVMQWIRVHW